MHRYSILSLVRHALSRHRNWPAAWRQKPLRTHYDVVIVGGGGQGLATAYYLAKTHDIRHVAVLEGAWLGGGNTGRNTTTIRSDYQLEASGEFKELAPQLWEGLSRELNFNLMVSQRGYVDLAHGDAQLEHFVQRANAMRLPGVEASILDREQLQARVPLLDCSPGARFPIVGALLQERGATVRHDAVAWAYARAADRLGVTIVQHTPVTAIGRRGARWSALTPHEARCRPMPC